MEVSRPVELSRIEELNILHNVRLLHRHDLNPVDSSENLRVQFELSGELRGTITSYLCLDGHELTTSEKDLLLPLFVESMNILIGRQISLDDEIGHFRFTLSSPKLNRLPMRVRSSVKGTGHKYELALDSAIYTVFVDYSLETLS